MYGAGCSCAALDAAGSIDILVQCLHCSRSDGVQGGAACVLALLCEGTDRGQAVVAAGGIPALMPLLRNLGCESAQIAACWALEALAGASPSSRDAIVAAAVVPQLMHLQHSGSNEELRAAADEVLCKLACTRSSSLPILMHLLEILLVQAAVPYPRGPA